MERLSNFPVAFLFDPFRYSSSITARDSNLHRDGYFYLPIIFYEKTNHPVYHGILTMFYANYHHNKSL